MLPLPSLKNVLVNGVFWVADRNFLTLSPAGKEMLLDPRAMGVHFQGETPSCQYLMSVLHWIWSLLESPHIWAKLSELMLSRHAPSECPLTTKILPPEKRLLFSPQPDGTNSPPCQIQCLWLHFCWQYHHISTHSANTDTAYSIYQVPEKQTLLLYSQPVCSPASQTLRCKTPSPVSSARPGDPSLDWLPCLSPHFQSCSIQAPINWDGIRQLPPKPVQLSLVSPFQSILSTATESITLRRRSQF